MGREIRMVPEGFEHPCYVDGSFIPLFEGADYKVRADDWDEECKKWNSGIYPNYASEENKLLSFEEWGGNRPDENDYTQVFDDGAVDHYMMYETTSEGTPISPAFKTKEELARWLADNGASSFGRSTATYEQWLKMCGIGFAMSAVAGPNGIQSGVEFIGGK